jgi:hypothetical protein
MNTIMALAIIILAIIVLMADYYLNGIGRD